MSKISVVLPVYNGSTYLKDSIESVLNQTYQHFELIIVDDCSADNSDEIAQKYANSDPRIFYVRNETNLKLPESLNTGFAQATGEYWTWTSCDNLYQPSAFEELLKAIENSKEVALVYASMQIIDEHNNSVGFVEAGNAEDLIFRNVVGACFLYRKSIANRVGDYAKNLFLCEDYEYWLRVACVSSIKPISECLYRYRRHSESLSHNNEKEIIAKGIKVQKNYYSSFIKTRTQAALFYAYLRARDIYNPFRQIYLLTVFFYSPTVFFKELYGLVFRRFN
jgi:glycosyltransferase involved in cell wall biosynthesis